VQQENGRYRFSADGGEGVKEKRRSERSYAANGESNPLQPGEFKYKQEAVKGGDIAIREGNKKIKMEGKPASGK
jgi:hypothetical protein